jgi:hypothetical protein
VPPSLLVFDGRGFSTYTEWREAFDAWCDARAAWEAEHKGVVLPEGTERWASAPIPWNGCRRTRMCGVGRLAATGLVCREHGLTQDEHLI